MRLSVPMNLVPLLIFPAIAIAMTFLQTPASSTLNVPWMVFQFVMTFGVGLYAWISDRQWANREALDALKAESEKRDARIQDELDLRCRLLETSIGVITERLVHVPTSREVNALTNAVASLTTETQALRRQSDRIEEYLKTRGT